MRRIAPIVIAATVLFITLEPTMAFSPGDMVALPEPRHDGALSIEAALAQRRSVRSFTPGTVTLDQVSQLLWSAQGLTDSQGHRTAPSAGALYPLEIYLVASNVLDLDTGDRRSAVVAAAWGQAWIDEASCILVIVADFDRTAGKYGERAKRYVHMEVGHAAQNVYLQAAALGLGTTIVGAFRDADMKRLIEMDATESPLALLPIGQPSR
jgi:nitroreductase